MAWLHMFFTILFLCTQLTDAFPIDIDPNDSTVITYVNQILQSMNTEYNLINIVKGTQLEIGEKDIRYWVTLALHAKRPINRDEECDLKFIKRHLSPARSFEIESFNCKAEITVQNV